MLFNEFIINTWHLKRANEEEILKFIPMKTYTHEIFRLSIFSISTKYFTLKILYIYSMVCWLNLLCASTYLCGGTSVKCFNYGIDTFQYPNMDIITFRSVETIQHLNNYQFFLTWWCFNLHSGDVCLQQRLRGRGARQNLCWFYWTNI